MKSDQFWKWFDDFAAPKLSEAKNFPREKTFRKMFEHLDGFDRPVQIIETGCVEEPDNWVGNGCSTILFDKYIETHPSSVARSIEIIPEKIERAKLICKNVKFYTGDSVERLKQFSAHFNAVDLLYLDASHHDWVLELPSQVHHLNELMAILPSLTERSMVAIDDSVIAADDYPQSKVIGKGGLVAQYALEVGADLAFSGYQVGFTKITGTHPKGIDEIGAVIERARKHVEAGDLLAADRLYRLVMIATPPPWSGRARVARGEACANFARNAVQMKKFGVAIDWFRNALEVDPRASDYRIEMVRALVNLGALNVARREASIAAEIEPENPAVWSTLGGVESDLMDAKACAEAYDKGIDASRLSGDPKAVSDAILNRATIALDTEDYDYVRKACSHLIELRTSAGDAWHVLAMLEYRLANHEAAITLFDKALAAKARNVPLVHWNRSLPLHSIGRYKEGWDEHAWGAEERTVQALYIPHHRFNKPVWKGEGPVIESIVDGGQIDVIEERSTVVHVHTEAGHGDNIAMLRYLPIMVERGYSVRYECDPALVSLVARSMPQIDVVPRAKDYPGALGLKPFDYHVPIGGLPHVFGTDIDTVPWRGPYLKADPELSAAYREILAGSSGRKIGLCWSSGIRRNLNIWMERYGLMKSMHFDDLKGIIGSANPDDDFFALQVGPERTQNDRHDVADVLPASPSWDETAALIDNLDLVITVDTGVAHLAGAMGKPTWILMKRDGASWHFMCWRRGAPWNEASPWYPSVRVFRQHDFHRMDWKGAVDDVVKALGEQKESGHGDGELKRHGGARH